MEECSIATKTDLSIDPYIYTLDFITEGKNKKNAFIIFGEHSRELITVETGLKLIKKLCDVNDR